MKIEKLRKKINKAYYVFDAKNFITQNSTAIPNAFTVGKITYPTTVEAMFEKILEPTLCTGHHFINYRRFTTHKKFQISLPLNKIFQRQNNST